MLKASVFSLTDIYLATVQKSQKDSNGFELLTQIVSELHALVSSSKPLVTWTARDAIQESREACGGHGYLRAANLGELRNNHDPSCTYEGDNNVLGQQASNWLLRQWKSAKVESPVGTANFIERRDAILGNSFDAIVRANGVVESAECEYYHVKMYKFIGNSEDDPLGVLNQNPKDELDWLRQELALRVSSLNGATNQAHI